MNEINLQNPEFLHFVKQINITIDTRDVIRNGKRISSLVQTGNQTIALMTTNNILDNNQIWHAVFLPVRNIVAFEDLKNISTKEPIDFIKLFRFRNY